MQLQFDNIILNVRPHKVHEWALTTAEVAEGFGVSPDAIRQHKSRNADELIEGKHYVSVTHSHAVRNQADTYWTKKGVVRLGFFIKSEQAKRFRDWAEDLVIAATEQPAPAPTYYLPQTKVEALRALAEEIEAHEATHLQLEAAKPKIEQYERTMSAEGTFSVADTAKMIGTGQNRLFDFLREQNILFYHRNHNHVYQQYIDNGWFKVVQKTYPYKDGRESYPQLHVTPKGVEAIRKKWDAAHRPAQPETAFQPDPSVLPNSLLLAMDPFQALTKMPELVAAYERVTTELIAAQSELSALKDDGYVNWEWVCRYLDVDQKTARLMLADVKIFAFGRKIKKFRRSDIVRFAEKHSIRVRDLSA